MLILADNIRPYGANKEYCNNTKRSQVFNRAEQSQRPYEANKFIQYLQISPKAVKCKPKCSSGFMHRYGKFRLYYNQNLIHPCRVGL